ncbi:unnamed protein product [Agarophyton chilense]
MASVGDDAAPRVLPEVPQMLFSPRALPPRAASLHAMRARRSYNLSTTTQLSSSGGGEAPRHLPPRAATVHLSSQSSGTATQRFMRAAIAANAPLVAVTGGLSFLGAHVVARMLTKGYFVRAIVPQGANVDFLVRLRGAHSRLQVVPVRDPAAEDARSAMLLAFRGVSTVVHAVSFSTHGGTLPKNVASKRIVDALKIALDAASAPGNVVINFIYMSSELCVFDAKQHSKRKTAHLTENDWFDCSKMGRESSHSFAFAHTVAEMRLWARVGKGNLPFNVCSVIPSLVLGPVLSARQVAATPSLNLFNAVANGWVTHVPDVPMSPVDARDVARAVTALTERPNIGGRLLLSAESLTSIELILRAQREFPYYRWPVLSARSAASVLRRRWARGRGHGREREGRRGGDSDAAARRALREAEFAGKDRRGRRYEFSQTRARVELGLKFRAVDDTIGDTLKSLERCDMLQRWHTVGAAHKVGKRL